ncbi:MAG: periplasmic heavy metal sensor [Rhizobiaceae bacterium]|nr:periplasmic heavy metal sensor [Rhizobiaceae bacterium]MCV0405202.1 periplasmic heavy metal sensor [Rhizobiaceae bacterium]
MQDRNGKPEFNGPTIEHDPDEKRPLPSAWSLRNVLFATAAVVLAGVGVAIAKGDGWGPGAMGHHMMGGFAERRVERAMDAIDATDEQEERIWAIIDRTRTELRPIGRGFRDSRDEFASILGAATIDKTAIEALRAERVAAMDEASKKAVAAMVEAAEVLTPEQRSKLFEHMQERRGWRR